MMKLPLFTVLVMIISMSIVSADPLACQPNAEQPMLPIYHIIGNVTKHTDGSINLEAINDCSGVTYKDGIYHVWHQCCQNHWDHAISRDLIHWQRLPAPIQPVTLKTWDGSISMLDNADPKGPVMIYDAQDGRMTHDEKYHSGNLTAPFDRPILGIARLDDPNDKYLLKWSRAEFNPVKFTQGAAAGIAFPGPIFKEGDHWNFIGQGSLFSSKDDTFSTWTREDIDGKNIMSQLGGGHENSGQWMMPVPMQVNGSAPPSGSGAPNVLINVGGGNNYVFATYNHGNQTLTPWTEPEGSPRTGQIATLERSRASWWGASGGTDNNGRMMMIGWATPDFKGDAGPGIKFLTRLTGLREVNYEAKTQNLVANPVPELKNLRESVIASGAVTLASTGTHVISGTDSGVAASADVELNFTGFATAANPVTFGACVLGSAAGNGSGLGLTITVDPDRQVATVMVGACKNGTDDTSRASTASAAAPPGEANVTRMMNNTNFLHGDIFDHEFPAGTEPSACQQLCDKTAACEAWTFLKRGPNDGMACCIKGPIAQDGCPAFDKGMWSGAKTAGVVKCDGPAPAPTPRGTSIPLFDEDVLTVRIMPDRSVADFFVQGGRWAGTTAWIGATPRKAEDSRISVYSESEGISVNVGVWTMGCGWLTPSYTETPTV